MSACTYTNVQLSGGNIKSLLNVKRKSSTGTGGKGEGEEGGEGGEEDLLCLAEELEEGTDSDEDSSEGYTPVTAATAALGQKRGAPLSFSASSALTMSSFPSGSSVRKRVRSSSSSSSSSSRGGGVSLEESLAADECLEGEGEEEEGSEGNTSAGAHSEYSSSLGDEEEDEEDDYDEDDEEEEDEDEDTHHSFPSSHHAVKRHQSHIHLPPHQQQHHQQHQLQLERGGPPRLTFTLSGGIRTCHSGPTTSSSLPSSSSTSLPTTTLHTTSTTTNSSSSNSSSSSAGAKPLDLNALPNFFSSFNMLPAPSPRGADDLFPSCLASFDPLGDSASSPWAWVEPPISGSLSSLSLETGCGMTPLGTLDEGNSNHSAFAREPEEKHGRGGGREGGREHAMPSAAAIAAAALCSPRGENAFLLSVEQGGDFWGGKAASASS